MVAVALLYRKFPEDKLDSLLFWAGVSLFLLELYKQLYYLVVLTGRRYNFGILPLQFCSYSLYLYLILPLLPAGKIKDALLDFVALYQTMGFRLAYRKGADDNPVNAKVQPSAGI